jgi:hypothetical protein
MGRHPLLRTIRAGHRRPGASGTSGKAPRMNGRIGATHHGWFALPSCQPEIDDVNF